MFLRASHHGAYYGKYIEDHGSVIVWISWTKYMKHTDQSNSNLLRGLMSPRIIIKLVAEDLVEAYTYMCYQFTLSLNQMYQCWP